MRLESGTQRATILRLLSGGTWVPLPEILELGIAQYSARIHELRKLGYRIENKTERRDGRRHSWFRLASGAPPRPIEVKVPTPPRGTGLLFTSLPERHLDNG